MTKLRILTIFPFVLFATNSFADDIFKKFDEDNERLERRLRENSVDFEVDRVKGANEEKTNSFRRDGTSPDDVDSVSGAESGNSILNYKESSPRSGVRSHPSSVEAFGETGNGVPDASARGGKSKEPATRGGEKVPQQDKSEVEGAVPGRAGAGGSLLNPRATERGKGDDQRGQSSKSAAPTDLSGTGSISEHELEGVFVYGSFRDAYGLFGEADANLERQERTIPLTSESNGRGLFMSDRNGFGAGALNSPDSPFRPRVISEVMVGMGPYLNRSLTMTSSIRFYDHIVGLAYERAQWLDPITNTGKMVEGLYADYCAAISFDSELLSLQPCFRVGGGHGVYKERNFKNEIVEEKLRRRFQKVYSRFIGIVPLTRPFAVEGIFGYSEDPFNFGAYSQILVKTPVLGISSGVEIYGRSRLGLIVGYATGFMSEK